MGCYASQRREKWKKEQLQPRALLLLLYILGPFFSFSIAASLTLAYCCGYGLSWRDCSVVKRECMALNGFSSFLDTVSVSYSVAYPSPPFAGSALCAPLVLLFVGQYDGHFVELFLYWGSSLATCSLDFITFNN